MSTTSKERWAVVLITAVLAACATQKLPTAFPRVAWSSVEETLASIAAWPDPCAESSPWAIYVAIPEDLPVEAFGRIHTAIRERGYMAPHSEPSMLGEMTDLTARVALADPVASQVFVTQEVAQVLWEHSIPFGIEAGNSHTAILPRRAVPLARRVLAGVMHPDTRWTMESRLLHE